MNASSLRSTGTSRLTSVRSLRELGRSPILFDQLVGSVRNLLVLVCLSATFSGSELGYLVIAFTFGQMMCAIAFAAIGEPVLLAPSAWLTSSARWRLECGLLGLAGLAGGIATAAATVSGSGLITALGLGLLISAMAWSDSERALHFRGSTRVIPLLRNLAFVASLLLVWGLLGGEQGGSLLFSVALVWLILCAVTRLLLRQDGPAPSAASWNYKRAAATGLVDVGISYCVIQATLLLCIAAYGIAFAAPLRLAQSIIGPVQVVAAGLRAWLSARLAAATGRFAVEGWIWLLPGLAAAGICLVALLIPSAWGEALLGDQWRETVPLLVPLALQATAASFGTIGAARMRQAGHFGYSTGLRLVSAAISISALGVMVVVGVGAPEISLLGLAAGPVLVAPLWVHGKQNGRQKRA